MGADIAIARVIARNTKPAPEAVARALRSFLFWWPVGWPHADETTRCGAPVTYRGVFWNTLKAMFDQTRPNRRTVLGHLRRISFFPASDDAFPSGHALHMGALALAAGTLPAGTRGAIQTVAAPDSRSERFLERLLRLWIGYPLERSQGRFITVPSACMGCAPRPIDGQGRHQGSGRLDPNRALAPNSATAPVSGYTTTVYDAGGRNVGRFTTRR